MRGLGTTVPLKRRAKLPSAARRGAAAGHLFGGRTRLVDSMGGRIDELEKNIGSLLEQAGLEDAAAPAGVPAGAAAAASKAQAPAPPAASSTESK